MWDNAGGGCNVAVPNLPRQEIGQAGVYWLSLVPSVRTSGGRLGTVTLLPLLPLKACCPTNSLLSVWDNTVGKF